MWKKISNAAHAVYYGIHYQKSLSRNQIKNCYYSMCMLEEVYFLYATVSRMVSVTDFIHLLSVIWHTTSTRTYRIISAAAQKPDPNPCGPGSVPLCTVGMCALSEIDLAYSASVVLRSDGLLYWLAIKNWYSTSICVKCSDN